MWGEIDPPLTKPIPGPSEKNDRTETPDNTRMDLETQMFPAFVLKKPTSPKDSPQDKQVRIHTFYELLLFDNFFFLQVMLGLLIPLPILFYHKGFSGLIPQCECHVGGCRFEWEPGQEPANRRSRPDSRSASRGAVTTVQEQTACFP